MFVWHYQSSDNPYHPSTATGLVEEALVFAEAVPLRAELRKLAEKLSGPQGRRVAVAG